MITEEQTKDLEYVKSTLSVLVKKTTENSDKIKDKLTPEVLISIVYLKIFSAYFNEKKFDTIEDAWKFVNDIKGVVEKIFYVNHYLERVSESFSAQKK